MGVSVREWCKGQHNIQKRDTGSAAVLQCYRVGVPRSDGLTESIITTVA